MPKRLMGDKDRFEIDKQLQNLDLICQDLDRAEKCGINCDERKERAAICREFLVAVKKEYLDAMP